ncbi:methyltransferase [Actinacidiphila sp. bgisy144]|uniref:methyltransferase n=1 Tax=Actinacidiphila sp. bgisy144 TaxID=3413791 RepID=UPI003EC0F94A
MHRFSSPWGDLDLTRYPAEPREQLRAWDAADAYALQHLADTGRAAEGGRTVVVGDRWGALTTALAAGGTPRPTLVTDSYLGRQAAEANLRRAIPGAPAGAPASAPAELRTTRDEPPARIDLLIVRVPKSLALLEDQLHRLAPAVHPGTTVLGTGMVSEIHTSTLRLFERIIGPTTTSLAVRKARLVFCTPEPGLARGANPWPLRYALPDGIGPMSGRTVVNHAGVFCADRLDLGTRLLLAHLPDRTGPDRVVDLGCGNGVLGTAAALANPDAEVLFTDESYQAVASAEETFHANAAPGSKARFAVGDALTAVPPGSADLVLLNPPFHSHRATTDAAARRMFTTAHAALAAGGELRVVANRHLAYLPRLRRLFGNGEVAAANPKYVVLRSTR